LVKYLIILSVASAPVHVSHQFGIRAQLGMTCIVVTFIYFLASSYFIQNKKIV